MNELNGKVDESNRTINDLQTQKNRLQQETADLTRQLEEAEHRVGTLTKEKASLSSQLEEAKRSLEDETRVSTRPRPPQILPLKTLTFSRSSEDETT